MSSQLKRMLMEIGLQFGVILLSKFQRYVEKDDVVETPRRRSSDVNLDSLRTPSNGKPDRSQDPWP